MLRKKRAKKKEEATTEIRLVGYKMTRPDGMCFATDKGTVQYAVGKTITEQGAADGQSCGVGLHLGKQKWSALKYNAQPPLRLFKCSYLQADVLGEDNDKVRVKMLRVDQELDAWDWGLPNCMRLKTVYDRAQKMKGFKAQTPNGIRAIRSMVHEHAEQLTQADKQKRTIVITEIKFHSLKEWASVRDSVRDSVWDSVRASVWASVRDSGSNPFVPCLEIAELGAAFYGIDRDGIAHVIAPSEDEVST